METKKQEEIQKQAKEIMKKFAASLEKIKFEGRIERREAGGFREEQEGKTADPDFRKRFFDNAPKKDDDFIIAEKKEW